MTTKALIREADLRRWARVAREEGVAIHGCVDSLGVVTIYMTPTTVALPDDDADLRARLDAFGAM
jgi:hypothetical protein